MGNNEKNIKFINGFLNFLFDIKEEDNIRLKIERKENEDFIEKIFISSNKGNFKFNCINIEKGSYNNEDIKQLIQFGKTEKNENLIILNQKNILFYFFGIFNQYEYFIFFYYFIIRIIKRN